MLLTQILMAQKATLSSQSRLKTSCAITWRRSWVYMVAKARNHSFRPRGIEVPQLTKLWLVVQLTLENQGTVSRFLIKAKIRLSIETGVEAFGPALISLIDNAQAVYLLSVSPLHTWLAGFTTIQKWWGIALKLRKLPTRWWKKQSVHSLLRVDS